MSRPDDIREFWSLHAPGLKWLPGSERVPVSRERCAAVRAARYGLEPHLEELAGFTRHAGRVVVEVGCGIGTDGTRFQEGGASYIGFDSSGVAVRTARATFDLLGLPGAVLEADATAVPVRTASVDVVYSNAVLLPLPGAARLVRRVTGEPIETLDAHRELLRHHGLRYLTHRQLFLANNTDGPGNPLSKVFSAREARRLFAEFREVDIEVRHLNLRTMPALDRLLGQGLE